MEIPPEVQAGIDAHRARYEALRAAGAQVAATLPLTALDGAPDDSVCVLHREAMPGGWCAAPALRRPAAPRQHRGYRRRGPDCLGAA